MNEKILKRKVEEKDFYYIYLKTLNGHLALTKRELAVLVELCKTQSKYQSQGYTDSKLSKLIFGSSSREEIRTTLDMSPFNLNNIIKSLKEKKILILEDKRYTINPRLFVSSTDKEYSINFKIEII